MKLHPLASRAGFTIVEMSMSVTCGLMILAAVVTAGVALQRSFMAVEGYSIAEGDQLRIQDYIALDLRRANSATVDSVANIITLTLPAFYDANGNTLPPIYDSSNSTLQYNNGATVTVSYYLSGSNFMRQVNNTATAIATNVSTFIVESKAQTDQQGLVSSVSYKITFSPRFVYVPGPGPVNGTTISSNTFLRNAVARN